MRLFTRFLPYLASFDIGYNQYKKLFSNKETGLEKTDNEEYTYLFDVSRCKPEQVFMDHLLAASPNQNDRVTTTLECTSSNETNIDSNSPSVSRPLVIWHGFGDSYNSSSMQKVFELVRSVNPDTYIYSISLGESNDMEKSVIADMHEEIKNMCDRISIDIEILDAIDKGLGVNVMGFSQGGLFVRSLIETCDVFDVHNSVHSLVTFGSPHNGILELPKCAPNDYICENRNKMILKTIWNDSVQKKLVFAQYFRISPYLNEYDTYLRRSNFLAYMNNEVSPNIDYKNRLSSSIRKKFLMVKFDQDTVVLPKETAWFWDWFTDDEENDNYFSIPFKLTNNFRNNLIGMKTLYMENKLEFDTIDDEHMKIPELYLIKVITKYF